MLTEVQAVHDRLEGQTALSDKTVAAPTVTVGLLAEAAATAHGGGAGTKGNHAGGSGRRGRGVRRIGSPVLVPPTGARA